MSLGPFRGTQLHWSVLECSCMFILDYDGPVYEPAKIAKPTVFQVVLRGIGKSFQSAITAPRLHLTGYGNAAAQS